MDTGVQLGVTSGHMYIKELWLAVFVILDLCACIYNSNNLHYIIMKLLYPIINYILARS